MKIDAYVVVSGEFTGVADESSFMVRGNFHSKDDAIEMMKKLRDESLKEFKDKEFVEFESENQVVIRMKDDDNYMFQIEVSHFALDIGEIL